MIGVTGPDAIPEAGRHLRQALADGHHGTMDWLQETAFPGQPMGRAILGPPERVRAFGKADLGGFIVSSCFLAKDPQSALEL